MNRRDFLRTSATAAAAFATPATLLAQDATPAPARKKPRVKLGLCTYSYWHFRDPRTPIETVIDKAAALGVDGIDVLHRQMDLPEKEPLTAEHRAYLRKLKRHAYLSGVGFVCLSTHQRFLNPNAEEVAKNVEHTKKCIEICSLMGVPAMRINTGQWNTSRDFDDLMAQHGVESPMPGHTDEEGFKWVTDAIQACLGKAEECGVILALENHWGLGRTAKGLLRIVNEVNSPWLGVLMDTGNFLTPPYTTADYDQLAQIAPKAVYVQAKAYPGGGEWYSLDIDYDRIASILADVNYTGYVSLEMEGKEDPDIAVPKCIEMLRKHLM